jgi:hypothetical protein
MTTILFFINFTFFGLYFETFYYPFLISYVKEVIFLLVSIITHFIEFIYQYHEHHALTFYTKEFLLHQILNQVITLLLNYPLVFIKMLLKLLFIVYLQYHKN